MEGDTIFDRDFENSLKYSRRKLLHVWLRIYLVGGILVGAFTLYAIYESMMEQETEGAFMIGYVALFAFMVLYILKYVLLWLEVRAAIRWNWVVGALNTLLVTTVLIGSGSPAFTLLQLVSIPYWIMLWKIQRRWEKEAVPGRQLKAMAS